MGTILPVEMVGYGSRIGHSIIQVPIVALGGRMVYPVTHLLELRRRRSERYGS